MKTLNQLEDFLSGRVTLILIAILGIATLASAAFVVAYISTFHDVPVAQDAAVWGQLGDYFGGTLNPVFGFLSVIALLVALVIQSKELRLSREALEVSQQEYRLSREEQEKSVKALDAQNAAIGHQRFEQTFFAWLGTYRQMLECLDETDIEWISGEGTRRIEFHGRRVLRRWGFFFKEHAHVRIQKEVPSSVWEMIGASGNEAVLPALIGANHGPVASKIIQESWESLYSKNESQLGGLFRVLYGLIRWIDQHTPKDSDSWLYVSIVRAQLSSDELCHIFFNGHSQRGKKFKALANKYALFDNLEPYTDPFVLICKEVPPDGGEGYEQAAFNSDEAQKKYHQKKTEDQGQAAI